ncbi:MAG TPA: hypothetical protein VLH77_06930, partial [Gammaproteobacteria bacterium]|nr:hypothetical protein [Gammaproteobacteria bacterium]
MAGRLNPQAALPESEQDRLEEKFYLQFIALLEQAEQQEKAGKPAQKNIFDQFADEMLLSDSNELDDFKANPREALLEILSKQAHYLEAEQLIKLLCYLQREKENIDQAFIQQLLAVLKMIFAEEQSLQQIFGFSPGGLFYALDEKTLQDFMTTIYTKEASPSAWDNFKTELGEKIASYKEKHPEDSRLQQFFSAVSPSEAKESIKPPVKHKEEERPIHDTPLDRILFAAQDDLAKLAAKLVAGLKVASL